MKNIVKYYTGIGSRQTPDNILILIKNIANYLCNKNYILRSGGADGADLAFESGANDKKEIFIPWKGFNNSKSELYNIPYEAFKIAEKFHPVWNKLSEPVKLLHARNVLQILGKDLKTLSSFVICWTKNGGLAGGTAQALRIAKYYKLPIFNLYFEHIRKDFEERMGI